MRRLNLVALVIYPIVASLVSFAVKADLFWSLILFYLVPSVYLSFLHPAAIKKSAVFSLLFGMPISVIVDYLAHLSGSWAMNHSSSWLGYQIFGFTSVEQVLWAALFSYLIIMFYEYFFDQEVDRTALAPGMRRLIISTALTIGLFFLVLGFNPELLNIDYFYLRSGLILTLLPIVLVFMFLPRLSGKFLKTAAYFTIVNLIYELTALRLDQWSFPGKQFIGRVTLLGQTFPLEELFFFISLSAMALLCYYEVFDDDQK